ncbi:MAG: toll/interleukin-1 receptor domain-containing protein [Planctomycetota bacterium]
MNYPEPGKEPRSVIFVSHATEDKAEAGLVLRYLRSEGYPDDRIFFDSDRFSGIRAGSDWERELFEKLEDTACLLIIGTDNWCKSKWCFAEAFMAKNRGRRILPLALDKSILSSSIASVHALRDFDPNASESLHRLRDSLQDMMLLPPSGTALSKGWTTIAIHDPFDAPFNASLKLLELGQKKTRGVLYLVLSIACLFLVVFLVFPYLEELGRVRQLKRSYSECPSFSITRALVERPSERDAMLEVLDGSAQRVKVQIELSKSELGKLSNDPRRELVKRQRGITVSMMFVDPTLWPSGTVPSTGTVIVTGRLNSKSFADGDVQLEIPGASIPLRSVSRISLIDRVVNPGCPIDP